MRKEIAKVLLIVFAVFINISSLNAVDNYVSNSNDSDCKFIENVEQPDRAELIDNWLKLGLKQEIIIEMLGEPEEKGENEYWGAIGTYNQAWKYKTVGIELIMESEDENGLKTVASILLFEPCTLKTSKGFGIGADKDEIYSEYSEQIDKSFSSELSIVVGSVYGGIIFYLTDSKVNKIFVGAAAE